MDTADNHYEEKFEFPLWKIIKERAAKKDLSYVKAALEVLPEYEKGIRVQSMCRQMPSCSERISEHIVGTKGTCYTDQASGSIKGENAYKYDGPNVDPYREEHVDLIKSIQDGKPLNEAKRVAESTLTGIMGRISAYTGREVSWDWIMKASKLDLTPAKLEFGELPEAPVALPGRTQLV